MASAGQKAATRLAEHLNSKMFAVLAEPNRVELIKILLLHGPADIGTLAEHLPQDRSVISRHLKLMLDAQIVTCKKESRHRIYSLNGATILSKFDAIVEECRRAITHCCPPKNSDR